MTLAGTKVLPDDLILVPVKDLPSRLREQIRAEDGDYAVTRPKSRATTKIIDSDAAELLKEFQLPKTIVQAIVRYSRARKAGAEATLDEALPMLQRLLDARLLVPADSDDARRIRPTLDIGDLFAGHSVLECVQALEDVELYKVRTSQGELAALKAVRPGRGAELERSFDHEATVLSRLDGGVGPRLLGVGEHDGRKYLLIDWCPGVNAALAASEYRRSSDGDGRAKLLHLCCAVLDAYARLHARDVVHADVHPGNVLVTGDDAIKIFDYGLSRLKTLPKGAKNPGRGGVVYYYEPEFASASRAGRRRPPSSEAGEQYALAAMLYSMLTGSRYLEFSLEKQEMLRQIEEDRPLPFSGRSVAPWPEVESVLGKALSKDPGRAVRLRGRLRRRAARSREPRHGALHGGRGARVRARRFVRASLARGDDAAGRARWTAFARWVSFFTHRFGHVWSGRDRVRALPAGGPPGGRRAPVAG